MSPKSSKGSSKNFQSSVNDSVLRNNPFKQRINPDGADSEEINNPPQKTMPQKSKFNAYQKDVAEATSSDASSDSSSNSCEKRNNLDNSRDARKMAPSVHKRYSHSNEYRKEKMRKQNNKMSSQFGEDEGDDQNDEATKVPNKKVQPLMNRRKLVHKPSFVKISFGQT